MNKTKIEWCDSTFNPVTGCLHRCEYCYARGIAERFSGHWDKEANRHFGGDGTIHDVEKPMYKHTTGKNRERPVHSIYAPYPFGFDPTFHRYRLDEPQKLKTPSTIFVGSMCDLFGEWVPDEWIKTVFEATNKASQHRYLFLTKNPKRYCDMQQDIYNLAVAQYSPEIWLGVTITGEPPNMFNNSEESRIKSFLSIEPYLEKITWIDLTGINWVIIGAESGNRKDKVIPKREWVENIVNACREANIPVFMKDSLTPIMGEENMLREFPWEKGTT